ncbi:aminoglycoside phosphotransferase family protein [Streptomyces sp. 5-6(2022)]|uniref:phosphotransferase family protein n=1 Tax=Streptomyces sp. 5-6(2022) TaxID=2936510 RepID=UPI0023B97115|nr:aminoglycoside phosphotransferase family protein [Streptomyces sp. 5-6(2022)]
MLTPRVEESFALLQEITATAGLSSRGAEPIRLAENDLWRLPGNIVVRIARAGQEYAAAREVAVARWLDEAGIPAVRPLPLEQPVHSGTRAATFWEELPPHRRGTEADIAPLLRRLHDLPPPPFAIGRLNPFVRIESRLAGARSLNNDDQQWLLRWLEDLRQEWEELPVGYPECVLHGDAWAGNCAVTPNGAVLMDFERTSQGPPEWDLTSIAVDYESFGAVSKEEYGRFCEAYGRDVMSWVGYPALRGIRELRKVTFAIQISDENPQALAQARYRIACVRGRHGSRPWGWSAVA